LCPKRTPHDSSFRDVQRVHAHGKRATAANVAFLEDGHRKVGGYLLGAYRRHAARAASADDEDVRGEVVCVGHGTLFLALRPSRSMPPRDGLQ